MTSRLRPRLWMLMLAVVVAAILARWKGPDRLASYQVWQANRAIRGQLSRAIPLRFANGVTLERLFGHIALQTRGEGNPSGLVVYIDPVGLHDGDRDLNSTVIIDVESVPLERALRDALNQLGLVYTVKDGLLTVTDRDAADP